MILPSTDANPPLRLLAAFNDLFPRQSPGYIIQATGREMWIAAKSPDASHFRLHVPDLGHETVFDWRGAATKQTLRRRPLPRWARYAAGVIVHLYHQGIDVAGIDAVIVAAEPPGPRFDFSLGLAFATLWYTINKLEHTEDNLLTVVEQVRREYIEA
ncbi:MAG: hypothetical protein ACOCXZ_00860 [Chloroflexota bacterium]